MLLTLEGLDAIYNLNTAQSIELNQARITITYAGSKNLILDCQDANLAKSLFDRVLAEMSQHHPVIHADRLTMTQN